MMNQQLITMPRYDSYKDTDVQWIGEIPSTWKTEKAKWLFIKANRPVRKSDDVVTCFRDGQVTLRTNRRTDGFTNALKEHGYQGIRKGDLVIHAMDAFAGAIGVSESDGKSTPVYSACVPRVSDTVDSFYYASYMRDLALSGFLVSLAKGIRERSTDFRFNDFAELQLPVPSLSEQTAIANFLDQKTNQIDEAIAIKEKQIALLQERKQILIQNAVTRGLDPNVKMKDSGVEWIGEVPEHWELSKLGNALNPVTIKNHPEFLLLSITREKGVIVRDLDNPDENHNFIPDDLSNYKVIEKGQFGMNKMKAWQGSYGVSEWTGIISPAYYVFSFLKEFHPPFFHAAIRSKLYVSFFGRASDGVRIGQWDLSKSRMKEIPFVAPPLEEQVKIVDRINDESEKTVLAIKFQLQQIEKLKEYKTTLINSAVTGKIKVA